MTIEATIHLDDDHNEISVAVARWDGTHTILRIGGADVVFPLDPDRMDGICDDLIECLREVKAEATRRRIEQAARRYGDRGMPADPESATYRTSMADAGLSAKVGA